MRPEVELAVKNGWTKSSLKRSILAGPAQDQETRDYIIGLLDSDLSFPEAMEAVCAFIDACDANWGKDVSTAEIIAQSYRGGSS